MATDLRVDLDEATFAFVFIENHPTKRLVSLALYGTAEEALFAGLWVDSASHMPQHFWSGTFDEYSFSIQPAEAALGYYPILVSAAGYGNDFRIAVIFEKALQAFSSALYSPHATWGPIDQLANTVNNSQTGDPGLPYNRILSIDVFGLPLDTYFACVLLPLQDSQTPQSVTLVDAPSSFAEWEPIDAHRQVRNGWARPERVVPLPIGSAYPAPSRFFSHWRTDTFAPWPDDMLDSTFQMGCPASAMIAPTDAYALQDAMAPGYEPMSLGANGANGLERLCVVFRPRDQETPLPKTRVVRNIHPGAPWRVPASNPVPNVGPPHPSHSTTGNIFETQAQQAAHKSQSPWVASTSGLGISPKITPRRRGTDYSELDEYMFGLMESEDTPGAQIAVARDGGLVINRSYTWAAANYPVVQPNHRIGIGSISKALTAMAVVALYSPVDETTEELFGQNLAQLFDIPTSSPNFDLFQQTTLEHLLRHVSGWYTEPSEGIVAEYARPGQYPALPGDTLTFLRTYDNSAVLGAPGGSPQTNLYVHQPGSFQAYTGASLRALGELLSKKILNSASETNYVEAMQTWWTLSNDRAATWTEAWMHLDLSREAPAHAFTPGYGVCSPPEGTPFLAPTAYATNPLWSIPAGGWSMAAATLVRILCGMQPGANVKPLLSPAQTARLYEPSLLPAVAASQGRIWIYDEKGGSKYTPIISRIFHNGGWDGVASICGFQVVGGIPSLGGRSTAIAVLLNQDRYLGSLNQTHLNEIQNIVFRIESANGGWDVDLFPLI